MASVALHKAQWNVIWKKVWIIHLLISEVLRRCRFPFQLHITATNATDCHTFRKCGGLISEILLVQNVAGAETCRLLPIMTFHFYPDLLHMEAAVFMTCKQD